MKTTLSGIAGFLDLAAIPIKTVLGKTEGVDCRTNGSHKVALIKQTPDGISLEKLVFVGEKEACQSKVIEMIQQGQKVVLEDFPLEEVADLCFKHNYRWRFHPGSPTTLKFVIEPGKSFQPDPRA